MNGHTGLSREGVQEVPSTGVTSPADLASGARERESQATAGGFLAPVLHVVE